MTNAKLEVQKRKVLGRKVKKLRRDGLLPANVYGKTVKSLSLEVPVKDFLKVYKEAGETGLIELKVDGETKPVLIHNVQLHPVTGDPLHADFHQVSLTEKTTAVVPIELAGEAPAVEQKIGVLIQTLSEVEVEALPQDFPDRLIVDVSGLNEVNDAVTVGDIKVDAKKVAIKADPAETVAKIDALAKEEEVVAPAAVEGEEGAEAPAEGGEAEEGGEAPEGESVEKSDEDKSKEE